MKLYYRKDLKQKARVLRANLTDAELLFWSRVRRKQILNIQFHRQKPIGNFIVDFFAPLPRLVIELDGSQHLQSAHFRKDTSRDKTLEDLGLNVLRFNNREVLTQTESVMQVVYKEVERALNNL